MEVFSTRATGVLLNTEGPFGLNPVASKPSKGQEQGVFFTTY